MRYSNLSVVVSCPDLLDSVLGWRRPLQDYACSWWDLRKQDKCWNIWWYKRWSNPDSNIVLAQIQPTSGPCEIHARCGPDLGRHCLLSGKERISHHQYPAPYTFGFQNMAQTGWWSSCSSLWSHLPSRKREHLPIKNKTVHVHQKSSSFKK